MVVEGVGAVGHFVGLDLEAGFAFLLVWLDGVWCGVVWRVGIFDSVV